MASSSLPYGGILTQNEARQQPSKNDIDQTKNLLLDFYIETEIPQFETLSQLLRWRRQVINNTEPTYEPKRRKAAL